MVKGIRDVLGYNKIQKIDGDMAGKKISVVIPVYNAQGTLRECLDNLFRNTYKDFEVILVNDHSSDRSADIAKAYPCRIVNLPERRGPAFARDRGLSAAGGEIVAFLDSDCMVKDDWLAGINEKLDEDILGIGGKYEIPPETNEVHFLFINYWDLKNILYKRPRGLISLSGGNCAFLRSALMRKRKKEELVYCDKRVGGDDTIMCGELGKFGKLVYDPGMAATHKKRCSSLNILKETINLGLSGATAAGICGSRLIKEPHRFYKTVLYSLSLIIALLTITMPFTNAKTAYLCLILFYLSIQIPLIVLAAKQLSRPFFALLFPAVIFTSDLLCFIGHVKKGWGMVKDAIGSFAWHIKLLRNIIKPSALSRIFLFVTKKCNAKCYFCFNRPYEEAGWGEDLSLDEIKNISAKVGFLPWLTITGGEPFLRGDIYDICRSFYADCGTRIISIATNGTLPSRVNDTAERLLISCGRLYLTIIVALDSIGETHDRIKGIDGSYDKALDTLKRLNSLQARFQRLTLGVNTTVIKENADGIGEMLEYFRRNLDYDRQCLNLLREGPCPGAGPELISIERYLGLMKAMTFRDTPARPANSLKGRFNRAALEFFCERALEEFKRKKPFGACTAAGKFVVINNDGNVYACELLREGLGNLREEGYDLKKILKGPKTKEIGLKIKNRYCYCQWACAAATNGYFNISSYPHIFRRMMQF